LTSASRDERAASRAVPTPARVPTGKRGRVARIADGIGDLIAALPAAVLWALLGTSAIALGLAGSAYSQSRQRTALEAQRAALLEDVGLLSSALLPPVPDALERLIVSAAYRPADGPAAGGDFYDVFPLGPKRFGVLLGDVSGHGRESVTQAALARYTLRTLLAAGHGPGEAMALADGLLARDLAPQFVTVIAGVYDEASVELTYAKAGHAPPIVLGTAHDANAEEAACPLGLGLGEHWPEFRIQLSDRVSVCLYTDGLEDARLAGSRLGRDQVLRLLAAQDLPDAAQLIDDVGGFADHLPDDLAAVVLRGR
jgi:serine phosphatase RsbU (regulator of sigma subunit)